MTMYGATELANAFRTVRRNTLQIAEEIPAEKYDFVPAPGTRSVSLMLRHIAHAPMVSYDMHRDRRVTTLQGYDFPGLMARLNAEESKPRSKDQIVALLKSEGDQFTAWLESLSPQFLGETFTDPTGQNPRTRLENIMGAKEHEMHHRGQLMLIQRILGIVPHLTRQREDRMLQHQTRAAQPATAAATS